MVKLLTEVKHLAFPQFTEKRFHHEERTFLRRVRMQATCQGSAAAVGAALVLPTRKNRTGNTKHPTPKYGAEMYMAPFANCHQTLVL